MKKSCNKKLFLVQKNVKKLKFGYSEKATKFEKKNPLKIRCY